jgi:hypothetical protein
MQYYCNGETVQARIADDQAPSIFLPLANFHGNFCCLKKEISQHQKKLFQIF